ncbi:TIGR03067 domain-containing protein [Rhodopirellula sp. SM50]|nr:TIGR03067 domain-containing protein [Rhodopirellula sp. SM50]PAY18765.1 TIGR03067 domain-containing protein [Rhodopirellula sp. SM50]
MRSLLLGLLLVGIAFPLVANAEDAQDQAVKKDRKKLQGVWQVTSLVIAGNKANDEDVKKMTVVNGDDGTWSVRSEGKETSKGVSTISPSAKPKTIDFTATEGGSSGEHFVGIYQLGKNKRKLCFVRRDKDRPTDFTSTTENQAILVTYKRIE